MNVKFEFPSADILSCLDPWTHLERAARVCYNSTPATSAQESFEFLKRLESRKHMTPFEHCVLSIPEAAFNGKSYLLVDALLGTSRYPRIGLRRADGQIVGTVRAFIDAGLSLEFLHDITVAKQVPYYVTMCLHTDRGIANEFVRHRTMAYDDNGVAVEWQSGPVTEPSLVQQSTRFVSFKDQVTFYLPATMAWSYDSNNSEYSMYCDSCQRSYLGYVTMVNRGIKPQIARNLLPLALGTVVVMSAYLSDWQRLLELRLAPDAHPEARYLASCIWQQLKTTWKQVNPMLDEWSANITDIVQKAKENHA